MNHPCFVSGVRRPIALVSAVLALSMCSAALAGPSLGVAAAAEDPLGPFIVGGQEASISQFPWQVYLESNFEEKGSHIVGACGGSILDSRHILTAAHCVDVEGTTNQRPPVDFTVVAGDSNVNGSSPTTQVVGVSSIRTHPYFTLLPETKDDVAVLTLSKALTLSAAMNAEAIPLVATGATPAPGTVLSVSGYGLENGAQGAEPNGRLYATSLARRRQRSLPGGGRGQLGRAAVRYQHGSSTCRGDSGGPLTEGNPAVQVGIVDFGLQGCPVNRPDGFTNVAAPEVRAFIEGSESPPMAARPVSPPVVRSAGAGPVDFGPLTCEPGAWSGSPSFTYTFQVEDISARVLQSGPSNVYVPPASMIDLPLVCIVQATNPGGVTTTRSATTPPIALDTAHPASSISGLRCHLQSCTLSIAAADPNGVALGVRSRADYAVTASCPVKRPRKKAGKSARRSHCAKTVTVPVALSNVSAGLYRGTATRLPFNKRITFTTLVTNAAGLRPLKPLVRYATLHRPSSSKHKAKHRGH